MKRLFVLLIATLFITVGCGNNDTENKNSSGEGEVSPGNEGTGETLPTKEDLDNGEVEDITPMLEHLEYSVEVDMNSDQAVFLMELFNSSDEKMELGFSSGQQFEIVVRQENNEDEVYRYSEGMMFTEALEFKELNPNESLTWEYAWNYEGKNGKVGPGDFVATVTLMPMSLNQTPIDANPFVKDVAFGIAEESESTAEESTNQVEEVKENNAFRNVTVTGENGSYVVTGEGRVFEAQFSYHVEDGHYILVDETFVQLNEGAPSWSDFEIKVELGQDELPTNGTLSIVLYERSAKDGQPTNEMMIPLEHFPGK